MKMLRLMAVAFGLLFVVDLARPVSAQEAKGGSEFVTVMGEIDDTAKGEYNKNVRAVGSGLKALGMGLAVVGAGLGIGLAAKAAVESYARQPEMQGPIFVAFLIGAALIEGVAFAAIIFSGFVL
jgi:F-type H+-transporting ATPase subunit c